MGEVVICLFVDESFKDLDIPAEDVEIVFRVRVVLVLFPGPRRSDSGFVNVCSHSGFVIDQVIGAEIIDKE